MTDHMGLNYTGKLPNRPLDTSSEKTLAMQTLVYAPSIEKPGEESGGTLSPSYVLKLQANSVPDLVLVSNDHVFFFVHYHRVVAASDNDFSMLLVTKQIELDLTMKCSQPPVVMVPETSGVLNIILLAIYDRSEISIALDAFARYGLSPKQYASAGQPLYDLMAFCAPLRPIDTYALAAAYDLSDVAATASAHLLSFRLSTLSDALAARMGAVYLKKLFFLHLGRMDALKRVLIEPPSTHPETPGCLAAQQTKLTRAWALATTHVVCDAGPTTLSLLQQDVKCKKCARALQDRVACVVKDWAAVKVKQLEHASRVWY
ncbi:hypothetical protein C8Q72DRAFT_795876 [Fomitopsis betulina]|nr:hypothetical protein C8Q72DRAFT_795876 [Fomitopsis betulina]